MQTIDIELIKKEENEKLKMLRDGKRFRFEVDEISEKLSLENKKNFDKVLKEDIPRIVLDELKKLRKVEIINTPSVKVNFPPEQKIFGFQKFIDVFIKLVEKWKFPEIQKITGAVKADVAFPKTQIVTGQVKADVTFPTVQKIEGQVKAQVDFPNIQKVDVNFPEVQKTDIPIGEGSEASALKNNPTRYVPVRLTDGRKFYEVFSSLAKSSKPQGLSLPSYDFVALTIPVNTTEVYTFRSGGATGGIVCIVSLVYTDSSRTTLSTVTRS